MIGCGVAEEWEPSRRGICEHRTHFVEKGERLFSETPRGFVEKGERLFSGTPGGSGYGAKGFVAWIEFGTQGLDVDPKG